jgi:hypothetical protein
VQILQRLEPVDVGVVDLPQQLLRVLLDAVAIRRELQQDLLLLRDHHVDRGAPEVDLERIGVGAPQQRRRALGARRTGQQVGLAGVVPQEAREQRRDLAVDDRHGPARVRLRPADQVPNRGQDVPMLAAHPVCGIAAHRSQIARLALLPGEAPV